MGKGFLGVRAFRGLGSGLRGLGLRNLIRGSGFKGLRVSGL